MKHTANFPSVVVGLTALLPLLYAADGHGAELFRDSSQPVETRVADLLSRLTLEEKAVLLDHKGPTLERFDIRSDRWNQCLNGVMWDRPTTLFPTCIALAATWDTRLVLNRWLLTDVLKNEWRHEGFVVSDLGGVRTMVAGHGKGKMTYVDAVAWSVMAGCDFSDQEYRQNIPATVREGKLTEARLNDAVSRVLRVRFRLGEFDPFDAVPYSNIAPDVIGSAPHRAVALKAAQESIVLLQNRNQLLPLDKLQLRRIAVIGPLADRLVLNNYNGKPGRIVTALQGIKDRAGAAIEVVHDRGCDVVGVGRAATKIDNEEGFSGGASVKLEAQAVGEFIEFAVPVPETGEYELQLDYKSSPSRGVYQPSIDGAPQGQPVDMHEVKGRYGRSVTATVKNIGSRAGDEVAQLYLVPPKSDASRPRLMLRGFQRVHLRPGESKQVRFTVPDEKLAFWNTAAKRFEVPHGEWGVQIGASSADIRLQTKVAP